MFGIKRKHIIVGISIMLIVLAFYFIMPVSIPLVAALITALILDPLVKILQLKTSLKRHFLVMIVFTVFTTILGACIFFITTKAVGQSVKFVEDFPQYVNHISETWSNYEQQFKNTAQNLPKEVVHSITEEITEFLNTMMISIRKNLNIENISAIISYIPNFLVSFLVYLIALFLFMLDLPKIQNGFYKHLTDETSEKVKFMTNRISNFVIGFFKAQFLVSLIIFAVCLIGLLVISPKVAIIMSIVVWIIDLIPIIGSIIILGPWSLYHLLSGDIVFGTKLAILAIVLLIIRRTIEPKVMGVHMGLSPLATLIAMYLGLKTLGILGIIIGPLLLIIFKAAKEAGIIKLNFKI